MGGGIEKTQGSRRRADMNYAQRRSRIHTPGWWSVPSKLILRAKKADADAAIEAFEKNKQVKRVF